MAKAAHVNIEQKDTRSQIPDNKSTEVDSTLIHHDQEISALYETSLEINAQLDLPRLLQAILGRATNLLNTSMASLFLLKPDGETLEMVADYDQPDKYVGTTLHLGEGVAGRVVQTGEAVSVADYSCWEGQAPSLAEDVRRILGVPLKQGDQIIGVLAVCDIEPGEFTDDQIQLLKLFATQSAIAIENARLFDETRRRAHYLSILNKLARELTGLLEVKPLCDTVVKYLSANFDYINVAIFTVDTVTEKLVLQAAAGAIKMHVEPGEYRQKFGKGIIGQTALTGKMIIVDDRRPHPEFYTLPEADFNSEVSIPLKVSETIIGVLAIASARRNAFDEGDIAMLTTVAGQLAVALEKARLFDETQHRAEQLEALRLVSQDLVALRDLDTLLYQIVERAIKLLGRAAGGISLYRPQQQVLEWVIDVGERLAPLGFSLVRGEGINGKVWATGQPIIVNNYHNWEGKSPRRGDFSASVIGVPIQWGNEFLGVLTIADGSNHPFTQDDAILLSQFATQAAIAIQNVRLHTETQQRLKEQTALQEAGAVISSTLDLETVLSSIAERMVRIMEVTSVYICSYEAETKRSTVLAEYIGSNANSQERKSDIGAVYDLPMEFPGTIECLEIGRPETTYIGDPDLAEVERQHMKRFGGQTILTIPLRVGGQTIAYVELWESRRQREFTSEEISLGESIAQQAAIAIENVRLHEETQKHAKQLEQILDTVQEGILLLDNRHCVRLANPMAQTYLSLLAGISVGETLKFLGGKSLDEILSSVIEHQRQELVYVGESRRVFELAVRPTGATAVIEGWVLVLREVTKERNIQIHAQQQDRLAAVGQLAAGIAHDFNNILTSIIGYTELARVDPSVSDLTKRDLEKVVLQSRRASHLVQQILDFSRQSVIKRKQIDLLDLLKDSLQLLERIIPENIELTWKIEPGYNSYLTKADSAQIKQVLTNLALNARDAMQAGGSLHFYLKSLFLSPEAPLPSPDLSPGDWIVLSITDTGEGISSEIMPRIFEPFFTTKEVGQGTGLGLAQVYGIIKQHEGYIEVNSQVSEGTTFTIYLPAMPLSQAQPIQSDDDSIPTGRGETILLVEDNATVLDVTKSMLEHLGYQVLIAINGREAIAIYEQYQDAVTLILTDATMPEMGGVALSQALRERNPAIKTVIMTGYPLESEQEAKDLLEKGIVDWLKKPVSMAQLAQTINRSLPR